MSKGCTVENCKTPHYARGYCKKHYTQIKRHGKLTPEKERSGGRQKCKAQDCGRTDVIHKYCRKHIRQIKKHGRLTPEREYNLDHEEKCKIEDCPDPHRAKGYCQRHYAIIQYQQKKIAAAYSEEEE